MAAAQNAVEEAGAEIVWDESAGQDYAQWTGSDGSLYQVWLENEKSVEARAKLVEQYELGGIAGWKLGLEDSSVWEIISNYIS